jgi:hypothetical protein
MDLQSVKAQHGSHWAWARTGAVILFLVTALLLAASLTRSRNPQSADAAFVPGSHISSLLHFASAG